jgi:hypothetical protein
LSLKASSMMELSPPAIECSITSENFTIPTFDAWCDRANRQADTDEPPDTGIFARLPGPKPPRFPPQVGHKSDTRTQVSPASRNYPETIPKLFSVAAGTSTQPARHPETIPKLFSVAAGTSTQPARHPETIPKLFSVAAGTSTQPARSPPGGDANFA